MVRIRRTLGIALVALASVSGLSGCGWSGEGEDVAAAILATSKVQTRSFSGAIKFNVTEPGQRGKKSSITMTFDGAIDTRDRENPKMVMNMKTDGMTTKTVVPGDGKIYFTNAGESYWVALPPQETKNAAVDPSKIYAVLAGAVGDFKPSKPMANAEGKKVSTVTATISKKQLCGPVLNALGDVLTQSSGVANQLGAGAQTPGDTKALAGLCKSILKRDPRVWFGIQAGQLTDLSLSAELEMPFVGKMDIELIYHEFNQGQEQSGFEPLKDAKPFDVPAQLPAA